MLFLFKSKGHNRLDFICSNDIQNQEVPSNWNKALTLLRNNWANEMVIRALSEKLHCRITIITTSGVRNFLTVKSNGVAKRANKM